MKELYILRMLQALRWTIFIELLSLSLFAFLFQIVLSVFHLTNLPYKPISFWIRIVIYIMTILMLCVRFQKDSRMLERCSSSSRIVFFMTNFLYENLWTGITLILSGAFCNWSYMSFLLPYNYTVMYNQIENKYYVNEPFVFIFTLGLWQGFVYFLNSYIFKQHEIFAFKANQQTSIFQDLKQNVRKIFYKSFINIVKPTLIYIVLYVFFRDIFLNMFSKLLLTHVNDKFSLLSNSHFILIALLTNTMFSFSTNIILFIFNIVLTKRHIFTISDLLQALQTSNQISCIKKLIYLDLVLLCEQNKERRKDIYKLSQPGGHPHTWNFVKDKCIQNISDYMKLLDGGCDEHQRTDGMMTKPQSALHIRHHHSNMRNLLQSDTTFRQEENKKSNLLFTLSLNALTRFKSKIDRMKTLPIYTYLLSNEQVVLSHLNDYQCVIWSIRSLTALICEALNEEAYGVVSNDVVDIILIMLEFKTILDESKTGGGGVGFVQMKQSVKHKYKVELRYCIIQCLYKISCCYANYLDGLNLPKNALLQLKSLSRVNISNQKNHN